MGTAANSGSSLIPALRKAGWQVLVITGTGDEARIGATIAAGALGCVGKAAPFDQLLETTVRAANGQAVLDERDRKRLRELAVALAQRRSG